jgi:hypothetical protein
MQNFFLREKLVAAACCLLGLVACLLMWHEAGLSKPGRKLDLFGGSNKIPFWEQQHPESKIVFCSVGYGCMMLGILGLGKRKDDEPEIVQGPAFIIFGVIMGFMLTQARTVTGVPMEKFQPGFYLMLAANGGLVAAGVATLVRAAFGRRG